MKKTPFKPRTVPMQRGTTKLKPRRKNKPPLSAELLAHHARVRALGCIVTGRPDPTLHHVHGGSMRGIAKRGGGQKTSDWLVIPLDINYHSIGGRAIDGSLGVAEWERLYGTQLDHLRNVCRLLKVDVFAKAGITLDT